MKTIYYSEFAKMIDNQDMLDSVKKAIKGTGTDLDSQFIMINDETFKVITDEVIADMAGKEKI